MVHMSGKVDSFKTTLLGLHH